ncbi:xanthine dehydrogenase family protein subunit M [Dehalococcoidia bacterium]|nr:xanthine dehydrogenase family protein subunit M [Dehalococcoidia bacterium]
MHDFTVHNPESLEETLILLDQLGDSAQLIAGGTALLNFMKQSLLLPEHVINLRRIQDLQHIKSERNEVHIGALVKHREIEKSELIQTQVPILASTYRRVATIRIRNMATIGGGLAHADPAQDPPCTLVALNASVRIASLNGERTIPIINLFQNYYENSLLPGEIITEVIVPIIPTGTKSTYIKFLPRTADDYATVSVSLIAQLNESTIQDVRIGLGAVAPTPIRATIAEETLKGQIVSDMLIQQAAESVAQQVDPLDDFRGSAGYKRDMAIVFTRRALQQVLQGPS